MSEPIDDIENAIERASDVLHNSREWEAEGVYAEYIAPALDRARTALTLATQRAEAAEAERDALRKERDILAARLEAAIELEAEVSGANRRLVRERDTMRTVCEAAAVYCGNRTVANEHALIDAAGAVKFLAVQP